MKWSVASKPRASGHREVKHDESHQEKDRASPSQEAPHSEKSFWNCRSSPFDGLPQCQAYLLPGDRRLHRSHHRQCIHPGERNQRRCSTGNITGAEAVGALLAGRLKEKGVEAVSFDRNGYKYHGRIEALAETLRKEGIKV